VYCGKTADSIEMPFGVIDRVGSRDKNDYIWVQIPTGRGIFCGWDEQGVEQPNVWREWGIGCVKTAEPIALFSDAVSGWTHRGTVCWVGVHIGATRQIRLKNCTRRLWVGDDAACSLITLGNLVMILYMRFELRRSTQKKIDVRYGRHCSVTRDCK